MACVVHINNNRTNNKRMKLKTKKDFWLVDFESKTLSERQELALKYLDYQVKNGGFHQWKYNGYQDYTKSALLTIDTSDNETLEAIIDLALTYKGSNYQEGDVEGMEFSRWDTRYYNLAKELYKN